MDMDAGVLGEMVEVWLVEDDGAEPFPHLEVDAGNNFEGMVSGEEYDPNGRPFLVDFGVELAELFEFEEAAVRGGGEIIDNEEKVTEVVGDGGGEGETELDVNSRATLTNSMMINTLLLFTII